MAIRFQFLNFDDVHLRQPPVHILHCTYRIVIENESVLILVEVVQRSLRDAILDLDGALDVLLVRELHLVING